MNLTMMVSTDGKNMKVHLYYDTRVSSQNTVTVRGVLLRYSAKYMYCLYIYMALTHIYEGMPVNWHL